MEDDLFIHIQRSTPATRVVAAAAPENSRCATSSGCTKSVAASTNKKAKKNKEKSGFAAKQPSYITQRFQPSESASSSSKKDESCKPAEAATPTSTTHKEESCKVSASSSRKKDALQNEGGMQKKVKKQTKRMRDKERMRGSTTIGATIAENIPVIKGPPEMRGTPRIVNSMNMVGGIQTHDEFGSGDAVTSRKREPLMNAAAIAAYDEFGSGDVVKKRRVDDATEDRDVTTIMTAGSSSGSQNTFLTNTTTIAGVRAQKEDCNKENEGVISSTTKKNWHGRGWEKTAPEVNTTTAGPAVRITSAEDVFSSQSFESVPGLEPRLIQQLTYRKFTTMTDVQSKALPVTLGGKDALIKAPTGSGKTLSFLVPMISRLVTAGKTDRSHGTVVLVLSPTKELCQQSHQVCESLTTMLPWLVSCQVSGGENPKSEKARLRKGVHVLFATPGRIAYHMEHSAGWKIATNMSCFIMDEADRLLDLGFEKTVKQIHEKIVKPRGAQTVLVSATLTESVKSLGKFCLKEDHEFVGGKGEESDQWTIPSSLNQWCVEFPAKQRLQGLISVLLQKKGKSIVFFSSCAEVDFHYDLFQEIRWPNMPSRKDWKPEVKTVDYGKGFVGVDNRHEQDIDVEEETSDRPRVFSSLKVFKLHGYLKAEERNGFIADFSKVPHGVLLASDVVARGIDLPCLNWIIQYDPPRQIEEYLHRVGRAARMGRAGDSCLFLQPHEAKYSDVLKEKGVVMKTMDSTALRDSLRDHLPNHDPLLKVRDLSAFLGSSITKHVEARPLLLQIARKAFSSWMRGYQTFPRDLKPIFNYKLLHPGHVAASFALQEAPTRVFHTLRKEALEPQDKGKGKGGREMKKAKFKKHSFVDEFAT